MFQTPKQVLGASQETSERTESLSSHQAAGGQLPLLWTSGRSLLPAAQPRGGQQSPGRGQPGSREAKAKKLKGQGDVDVAG